MIPLLLPITAGWVLLPKNESVPKIWQTVNVPRIKDVTPLGIENVKHATQ